MKDIGFLHDDMDGVCNKLSDWKLYLEPIVRDHSNESYWAVLLCGTVYYAVQGGSNFLSLLMKP